MAVIFDEVTADVQAAQRETTASTPPAQIGREVNPDDFFHELERRVERAARLHAN